jgi:hypothetical protein
LIQMSPFPTLSWQGRCAEGEEGRAPQHATW